MIERTERPVPRRRREDVWTQLRSAAQDYARRHMAPAMERVKAAAAAAAAPTTVLRSDRRPILRAGTLEQIVQQITTEIGRLEDVLRATEMAGRGVDGPPTERQIQDALDQHLATPNDHPIARAVAAETARWAQAAAAAPVNTIRATHTKMINTRRRLQDAAARALVAEEALAEAKRAERNESLAIVEGWLRL